MPRVLIVAFDGLQPSQVRADLTPNLFNFAEGGVAFARNHPVFPTVTRINVASLVTGHGTPARTDSLATRSLSANTTRTTSWRPWSQCSLGWRRRRGKCCWCRLWQISCMSTEENSWLWGSALRATRTFKTRGAAALGGATIHPEFCLPRDLHDQIIERFGSWPAKETPNVPQMEHGARVLIEYVLAERKPTVALIWFSEPDSSNHKAGVGSVLSNQALASADEQFGRIIGWLEGSGTLEETDVIAVSGPWVRDYRVGGGHRC